MEKVLEDECRGEKGENKVLVGPRKKLCKSDEIRKTDAKGYRKLILERIRIENRLGLE